MNYPQFLMACVDEYSAELAEKVYGKYGDDHGNLLVDGFIDGIVYDHDSMIIDIECVNYINHDEESCGSYLHLIEPNEALIAGFKWYNQLKVCSCKYPTQYCGEGCQNIQ